MQEQSNIFFKGRVLYFALAIAAIFTGAFALIVKIQDLDLEASSVTGGVKTNKHTLSIVFFGDAMFDRAVRQLMVQKGNDYPFEKIKDFVKSHDLAVLNLEGVYTTQESVSVNDNSMLRFTFDVNGIPALKHAGFDMAGQANNHTSDFGREGLQESKDHLTKAGIATFGDYFNEGEALLFEKEKQKVALVGYNEFSNSNRDKVKSEIARVSSLGYFVIVFAHWGEEYERFPNDFQSEIAREWIDSGADAVIGAHPHVIEPMEEYQGRPIFYSLGNFVFDQYFSNETEEGLALTLFLSRQEASFLLTPFRSYESQPALLTPADKAEIMKSFIDDSSVNTEWKKSMEMGVQTKIPRR